MAFDPNAQLPEATFTLTPEEHKLAGLYGALMERYSELPIEKSVPLQAVRLVALRYGYGKLVQVLLRRDVGSVARKCRQEIADRQFFLAEMHAKYPVPQEELAEAIDEMAAELAVIDSKAGAMRMLLLLDRILRREQWLQLRRLSTKTPH
jgi:hypothetical protein